MRTPPLALSIATVLASACSFSLGDKLKAPPTSGPPTSGSPTQPAAAGDAPASAHAPSSPPAGAPGRGSPPTTRTAKLAGNDVVLVDELPACDAMEPRDSADALRDGLGALGGAGAAIQSLAAGYSGDSGGWGAIATRAEAEREVDTLTAAIAANLVATRQFVACAHSASGRHETWTEHDDAGVRSLIADHEKLARDVKEARPKYLAAVVEQGKAAFGNTMRRQAYETSEQRCQGKPPRTIYFAWKDPDSGTVRYHFCDGVTVERLADGTLVRDAPALETHPEWDRYASAQREALEDARIAVERLGTAASRRDLAAAEKRYGKAMDSFIAKHYPERAYVALANKTRIAVATADGVPAK
jgi:hypothetical protein